MPAAKGRGGRGGAGLAEPRQGPRGESMATLCRLREVPRHLLVCEKSNFGHDKSRHRHIVETHYYNYRVSLRPETANRAPYRGGEGGLGEPGSVPREPALGVRRGLGLSRHAGNCSLLACSGLWFAPLQDYNSQDAPARGGVPPLEEGAGRRAAGHLFPPGRRLGASREGRGRG